MNRSAPLFAFASCLFLSEAIHAQHYFVDAGIKVSGTGKTWSTAFKTLTAGLAAAKAGQSVWVANGKYSGSFTVPLGVKVFGNFRPGDSRLSQRDAFGSPGTVLDGGGKGRVLVLSNLSQIDSLQITNGSASSPGGGGALCSGVVATIRDCVFSLNNAAGRGTALFVVNNGSTASNVLVEGCLFIRNGLTSKVFVHNIDVCKSTAVFRNNGIADNNDNGLHYHSASTVTMQNNYFVGNSGRGLCHIDKASVGILHNNLFHSNKLALFHHQGTDLKTLTAVNKLGFASSNLWTDPKFAKIGTQVTYMPSQSSPLVDAGLNLPALPAIDFSRSSRRLDGNLDGVSNVDIGPSEYTPNRIQITGSVVPGGKITLTLMSDYKLPTIMGIGLTPLKTGLYMPHWGMWFLDTSLPVIYVGWGMTGSATPLTIPSTIAKGTSFTLQNFAIGAKNNALSNAYDLLIR